MAVEIWSMVADDEKSRTVSMANNLKK